MIYLDNHSSTPTDKRVVEAMLPYFSRSFGNPASATHAKGKEANAAVEAARRQLKLLIGAHPEEIVFTAGATESNNLAIQGLAKGNTTSRRHIVTTSIEHKAVLLPCKELEARGYEVSILPVNEQGTVDLAIAREAITRETLLVSIQAANNEVGTIQPIAELAELAHAQGALIHTDAAQAVGKIPVDVAEWDVDLLSLSAHKLYGPKGVGALFIRGGPYAIPIKPLMRGGGQESDLRPGTLNVPGIVGLGEACRLCTEEMTEEAHRVGLLRDKLEASLLKAIPNLKRNGELNNRLSGNSSITFPGIDAEALIVNVPELALSTGSACTSGAPEPSHVLVAIGLSRKEAYSTLRVGLGRFTTEAEIEQAARLIIEAVGRLEALSA